MKNTLFYLFILALSSCAVQKNSTSKGPKINWISFDQLQDSLRHSPKKTLVDVYATWCGPCKTMNKVTFNDPEVIQYVNENFYAVKFDAERMDTITFKSKKFVNSNNKNQTHYLTYELASIEGKIAFPTTTILNDQLEVIKIQRGLLFPKDLLLLLQEISSE